MGDILKLGLKLFVICATAAGLLAGTNKITAPKIDEINAQANNEARQIVLESAKDFKEMDINNYKIDSDVNVLEIFEGIDGDETTGYTIKVAPKGYGGEIEIMVGITTEGVISGINIGNMSETPGLGAKSKEESFYGQYAGKPATTLEVVKSTPGETEIQAISGATITSEAVTHGVNAAVEVYDSIAN